MEIWKNILITSGPLCFKGDLSKFDWYHCEVNCLPLISSSPLHPDSTIAIWDFADLTAESCLEDVNVTHNPDVRRDSEKVYRHLFGMFLLTFEIRIYLGFLSEKVSYGIFTCKVLGHPFFGRFKREGTLYRLLLAVVLDPHSFRQREGTLYRYVLAMFLDSHLFRLLKWEGTLFRYFYFQCF